jgi:hypothetical protein
MKRISGSRIFRSPHQKDFCNNICHEPTLRTAQLGDIFAHCTSGQPMVATDHLTALFGESMSD